MKNFYLEIDTKPIAKARPRGTRAGHFYTPGKTKSFEIEIRNAFLLKYGNCEPLSGAVRLDVIYDFAIPKTKKKERKPGDWHIFKPDRDNLDKAIKDALNELAYKDDSQICDGRSQKRWENADRIEIMISEL